MEKNKKPILSICIPTWNRWYAIWTVVDSLCKQISDKAYSVDIVVSDNCSTDSTEFLIKDLQKKYSFIKYHKNSHNIWPMKNISKVMTLWDWEYLWWLWSDDLVCDWWIEKTMNLINKYHPDIIIHTYMHENEFKVLKDEHFDNNGGIYYFKSQKDYLNFLWDQYNYDKWCYTWFLEYLLSVFSVAVIKKDFYYKLRGEIIKEKWNEFFDTFNFIHVLCTHYDEVKNWIILVRDNYLNNNISNQNIEKAKKVAWTPSFSISNDSCFVFNYLLKKYKLNNNFKKLRVKSNFYWTMGSLSNLPLIKSIKDLLKKIWVFWTISSILKRL